MSQHLNYDAVFNRCAVILEDVILLSKQWQLWGPLYYVWLLASAEEKVTVRLHKLGVSKSVHILLCLYTRNGHRRINYTIYHYAQKTGTFSPALLRTTNTASRFPSRIWSEWPPFLLTQSSMLVLISSLTLKKYEQVQHVYRMTDFNICGKYHGTFKKTVPFKNKTKIPWLKV